MDLSATDRFVSSGVLPAPARVQQALVEAYERFAEVTDGSVSNVYPALESADPDAFGLAIATTDGGAVHHVGDAATPFTIMSVAKPFVLALVCESVGLSAVRALVGVNATGLPFNSVAAVEQARAGRTNPMVNPGAIATTSLVPGDDQDARWGLVIDGLSRFAGRELSLDSTTLTSALSTNHRNRALANMLTSLGALAGEPAEAVDLYTRQSCVAVTAADLAVMGATLANGGVNPVTGDRVVGPQTAHDTLGVMTVAGMYETSGDWLLDVGMPGKSGIGGGILCVSPGKGALATYAPPLDSAGNSVRGQLVARYLARRLGLDVLSSAPESAPREC